RRTASRRTRRPPRKRPKRPRRSPPRLRRPRSSAPAPRTAPSPRPSRKPAQSESPDFFVSLGGIDGSGKTTQAKLLAEALGEGTVLVREPGGTAGSEAIRDLLIDPSLP